MKKTHGYVSKSVIALALLGALPAAAGPATYSGSLCTSVSGFSAPTIYRSGRLLNLSTNEIEVVCPIQRNVSVPSFTEDMSILATVMDPHLTEDVCCTASVAEPDGTTITSSRVCTPAGTADTVNHKSISINLASVYASINGYVSLRCELPAPYTIGTTKHASVLASFYVSE